MPFHFWLSKISSGATYMDARHHDVVRVLTRLSAAADREFHEGYEILVCKVERIFRTEERWMEEIDFVELPHHRAQHASILGTLHHGRTRIACGDTPYGRNLVGKLLPEWLFHHASTMDNALARQLRETVLVG